MKQFSCLTFIILLNFLPSCNNKEQHNLNEINIPREIDLDVNRASLDSLDLSEIAEKVEYIPLETTGNILIDQIWDFVVTKDFIFILDSWKILKFTKDGKYVKELFKVGNGPGEAFCLCFAVDEGKEYVYVCDRKKYDLKIYDFDGTFISTIKTPIGPPEHMTYSIGYFNNSLFITSVQKFKVKYLYSCFDLTNDSIKVLYKNYRIYDKAKEAKYMAVIMPSDHSYQINASSILFKERYCDTIFCANTNFEIKPKYIIDLKDHKLTWEQWRDNGLYNFAGGPLEGYYVQSFVETDLFLFISLKSFRNPALFTMFNKMNGSLKTFSSNQIETDDTPVFIRNNLDKIIPFPVMDVDGFFHYFNNSFYSLIESKYFVQKYRNTSEKLKRSSTYLIKMSNILNNVDEFSNPVLMKVDLK